MRTASHDRSRHDHLRRIQASIQSDVDIKPVSLIEVTGIFVVSDEVGEPNRTPGKVAQIASRTRKV